MIHLKPPLNYIERILQCFSKIVMEKPFVTLQRITPNELVGLRENKDIENCLIYKTEYVIDGLASFEFKNYDRFEFQKYDCWIQILKI